MTSKQPSIRARRVADLVQREVANVIKKEISDPRLQALTITLVDVSPDLRNAVVFFTLTNLDGESISEARLALAKAAGFLRHAIASRCELRYVPKLIFRYDEKLDQAENLMSLITDVNKDLPAKANDCDEPDSCHEE